MNEIRLDDLLGAEGEVARRIPGFIARDEQIKMTSLVRELISGSKTGLIEAGTGTGKTLAYLLPLMLSNKKTIISTGTKNLQDQLFVKDIPIVNESFNRNVAILKGRANYLCPDRMRKNIQTIDRRDSAVMLTELLRIQDWSMRTLTGDLTELLDSEQSSAVMPLVTSTVDNCLGQSCESISECPVYRARARAIEADVVVVNHHLLFADTVLKEESLTRLLPDADLIVVDEAHQVPDVARLFFGERISTRQLFELARDIQREQRLLGDDDPELIRIVTTLENAVDGIVEICFSSIEPLELFLNDQRTRDKLEDIDIALGKLIARLQQVEQRSAGLGHCYSRAMRLSDLFALLTETDIHNEEYAHWIEKQGVSSGRRGFTIVLSPVSVATELGQLFGTPDKNWIFVSATMTIAGSFDHMKNSLGLDDVVESRFESVFDFAEQVRAYVPSGIPLPSSDMHTEKLLSHVLPFIRATTGRIFYLFTSHRAMEKTAELLNYEHDIVFLKQGALPKKRLLEKFRELPGCVLLATQSFWEGVDVRGSDLRCLIIDKLPFSSPENEMVRAQIRAIDSLGGNGFMQFSLPEAAISLKQGFGRLIREESDKGLFILGDSRIHTRNYGKILRQSLPPMTWLQSPDEVHEYILQLEKQPRMSHQSK